MALDMRDGLMIFMVIVIVALVLDRIRHDSLFVGYGYGRKLSREEFIERYSPKEGIVNNDSEEIPHDRDSSYMERGGHSSRNNPGERQ